MIEEVKRYIAKCDRCGEELCVGFMPALMFEDDIEEYLADHNWTYNEVTRGCICNECLEDE